MNPIYTYLAGILTVLIPMILKHFLAKSRINEAAKLNRFHSAADDFRAIIAHEITLWHNLAEGEMHLISYPSGTSPVDILRENTIRGAIVQFQPFITMDVGNFDKIYAEYEQHKKQTNFASGALFCNKGIKMLNQLLEFTEK